jgi:hypothetical protein
MAFTLTPKTNDDKTVYSDGSRANTITINVQQNGAPLSSTPLTGTLVDSHNQPAGRVSPGTTTAGGDITLTVVATVKGTLKLQLYAGQASGATQLAAVVFNPVTLVNNPALANTTTPVIVTATIVDAANAPVGGVPLIWQVLDTQLGIPDSPATTHAGTPSSYEYTLPALTDAEISGLPGKTVSLQLVIGPTGGGFTIPAPVPADPPLLAPEILSVFSSPPVIDDSVIEACAVGIPFIIPVIANTTLGDIILLMATPTGNTADARIVFEKLLDQQSVGVPFVMLAGIGNVAFQTNGPEYIFYNVTRSALGNTTTNSEQLLVEVERQALPTLPDGDPDPQLTDPQATPVVYVVDNYTNNDALTAAIDFNGEFIPLVGDNITVKIYLVGYTYANLNWVKKIESAVRQLAPTDFDANGAYIPYTVSFSANQLAGIDGSNGQVYFLVERGGQTFRSPSRPIIVDTMPAYSGSIART